MVQGRVLCQLCFNTGSPNPSALVTCFVLSFHLVRNVPDTSEICASPLKNLRKTHTYPKAMT